MENTSNSYCSKLPEDILLVIAEKLNTRVETLRVRAVCNNFRSFIPLPESLFPNSVLKVPLPNGPSPEKIAQYSLKESTVYAIQPLEENSDPSGQPKSWIVKVQEITDSGDQKTCRVRLMDPTYPLIVFENMSERLPKPFNLLDYRVKILAKAYELELDVMYMDNRDIEFREKVIFLLSEELDVMAFYKGRRLAVLRNGENSWNELENVGIESVQSIIHYNKSFYVVDNKGFTISVDCKSLNVTKMETLTPRRIVLGTGCKYLVKSDKNLYLLVEYWRCQKLHCYKEKPISYPVAFDVFKLDEERNEWVSLREGFDDKVFFLNSYCSYSLSADEFPGIKRNSVYFSDSDITYIKDPRHPGWVSAVYSIDEDKSKPLSSHSSDYSQIFWPPPAWLKWSASN